MDYIREELLRQRSVLAALLLGGGRSGEGRDSAQEPAGREASVPARLSLPRSGDGVRATVAGADDWEWPLPAAAGRERSAGRDAGDGQAAPGPEEMPGEAGGLDGETADVWIGGPEVAGAGDPIRSPSLPAGGGAVGLVKEVTEITGPALETAPGPETISRAFQRDARRYDGGFFLY